MFGHNVTMSSTTCEQAKKQKKKFEVKQLFIYECFVSNNLKIAQVGFQNELFSLEMKLMY